MTRRIAGGRLTRFSVAISDSRESANPLRDSVMRRVFSLTWARASGAGQALRGLGQEPAHPIFFSFPAKVPSPHFGLADKLRPPAGPATAPVALAGRRAGSALSISDAPRLIRRRGLVSTQHN